MVNYRIATTNKLNLICLGWKTKAQLMAMHNDEQIVSRIIDTKTRQQEYKEHPDAPGDINAMMFYVLVDLENVEEDEYEEEVRLEVSGEAYGEQVLHKNPFVILSSINFI